MNIFLGGEMIAKQWSVIFILHSVSELQENYLFVQTIVSVLVAWNVTIEATV